MRHNNQDEGFSYVLCTTVNLKLVSFKPHTVLFDLTCKMQSMWCCSSHCKG